MKEIENQLYNYTTGKTDLPDLKLEKGDKIKVFKTTYTIDRILTQDYFNNGQDKPYWDVEFLDENKDYHHWKSDFDGGEVVRKENTMNYYVSTLKGDNRRDFKYETLKDALECVSKNFKDEELSILLYSKDNNSVETMLNFSTSMPASDRLDVISYLEYKEDWMSRISKDTIENSKTEYIENLLAGGYEGTYEEYIEDFGFGYGEELYASFDEFLNNEFDDEEYMKSILPKEAYRLYEDLYMNKGKTDIDLD